MKRQYSKLIAYWNVLFMVSLIFSGISGCGGSGGGGDDSQTTPSTSQLSLESPVRITQAPSGNLLVSEFTQGKVLFVNPDTLEVVDHIDVPGKLSGIAVTDSLVFVGNETTGSVNVYDYDGNLLYKLGNGDGEFLKPNDVAINEATGEIYVVDTLAKVVKVYQLDGTLLISDFGEGNLQFPTGIAVDNTSGLVYISDFSTGTGPNGCSGSLCFDTTMNLPGVWVYSLSGNYLDVIRGEFSRPQGLAIADDLIYMVDSLLGQVIVFQKTSGGGFVENTRFGGDGATGVLMKLPLDPVIDPSGTLLFVTVNSFGKIQQFITGGGI